MFEFLEYVWDCWQAWKGPPSMFGAARSGKWPTVRRKFLIEHPHCAACGTSGACVPHHKIPFHVNPALELDPANLITLCESPAHSCHLMFGHLLCWSSYNPNVERDTAAYLHKVENRP